MTTLLLVAASLGLSNFAAAVGLGVSGVNARTRLEVGLIFGCFEVAMPVVGLLLGHRLDHELGASTRFVAGGLLLAMGSYEACSARWADGREVSAAGDKRRGRLVWTGLALSVDNLVIGFALGTYHVAVALAAGVIGVVSVVLSLIGLELLQRIGSRTGGLATLVGSLILAAVGIAIVAGA